MNFELPNNIELRNGEPNYDELLRDVDFTPQFSFCDTLDEQINPIMDKLYKLGYSKDFALKVAAEAIKRYDASRVKFLRTTQTKQE